jgi:hypothetical protein
LPTLGLDKLEKLRYLLLEGNRLTKLPPQIVGLRNLTALNLADNPLEYPPLDVVNLGLAHIRNFMRSDYVKSSLERDDERLEDVVNVVSDGDEEAIWASDQDEESTSNGRRTKRNQSASNTKAQMRR